MSRAQALRAAKLAIIAELFGHLIIGNGPRREPNAAR